MIRSRLMEIKRRLRPDNKFKSRVPGVRSAERERFGKIIKSALRLGEVGIRITSVEDRRGALENRYVPNSSGTGQAIRRSIDNTGRTRLRSIEPESPSLEARAENNDPNWFRAALECLSGFA